MADEIKINELMDVPGIQAGIQKVIGSIEQLTNAIDNGLKKSIEDLRKKMPEGMKPSQWLKEEAAVLNQTEKLLREKIKTEELARKIKEKLNKASADAANIYKQESAKLNDLRNAYKNLAVQGRENGKVARGIMADIQRLDDKLKKVDASVGQYQRNVGNYGGALSGLTDKLVAAFAVDRIASFIGKVVQTRAEFEKFEAVLTNSLGSKSLALDAMQGIQDFASKTPFSVKELTDSFVKLANQGFQPTTKQMTKLGDLASSTGKTFDQLTEAMLDAQTGEFERLKEFGIRAHKSGDMVKFTFKGVTKEVKGTDEAIRNYILSLGSAEGVSGSMAAISETLGGKISNLGDQWDSFLNQLGSDTSGAVSLAISSLSVLLEGVSAVAHDIKGLVTGTLLEDEQLERWKILGVNAEAATKLLKAGVTIMDDGTGSLKEMNPELEKFGGIASRNVEIFSQSNKSVEKYNQFITALKNELSEIAKKQANGTLTVNDATAAAILYSDALDKMKIIFEKANPPQAKVIDNTNKLTLAQLRALEAEGKLSKAQKERLKELEEADKKNKKREEDEEDLRNKIRQIQIDAINDEQRREEEHAKFQSEQKITALEKSTASDKTKAELQKEYEDQLQRDLLAIQDKYKKIQDQQVMDGYKKTIDSRNYVRKENSDFELSQLQDQYEKEKALAEKSGGELTDQEIERLQRMLDKMLEMRIQAIQDQAAFELSQLDVNDPKRKEIETKRDNDIKRIQGERLKANEEFNKTIEAQDKEAMERRKKYLEDFAKETLDLIKEEIDREAQLKEEALEKEISDRSNTIEDLRDLAANGNQQAAEQLAFEKEQLAKAELEKRQTQERAQKQKEALQMAEAFLNALNARLKQSSENPEKYPPNLAGAKALGDVLLASALKKVVKAAFWKGTENVEDALGKKAKMHNGRDGYLGITKSGHAIAFDGQERIMSAEQNKLIGGMSNEELALLANNFQQGKLLPDYAMGIEVPRTTAENMSASITLQTTLIKKLDEVKQAISNKKETTVKLDNLGNVITDEIENGFRTIAKHKRRRPRI